MGTVVTGRCISNQDTMELPFKKFREPSEAISAYEYRDGTGLPVLTLLYSCWSLSAL